MKVVIFIENRRFGGMDTFVKNLINSWPLESDEFILICNKAHLGLGYLKKEISSKVTIITHEIPLNWSFLSSFIRYLPNFIQRIFRQFFKIILLPYQYYQLRKLLMDVAGEAIIAVNGSYPGGQTCLLSNIAWASLGRKKSIHSLHGYSIKTRSLTRIIEENLDKKLFSSINHCVCVSRGCLESLYQRKNIKKNKLITIPNGISRKIDDNQKDLHELLGIRNNYFTLAMISNYDVIKGHEFLFKSMSHVYDKFDNINLILIGTGTDDEIFNVNEQIRKYLPGRQIYQAGKLNNAFQYMSNIDLVVIPSQTNESFGLTAAEAMLSKIAVVSTNMGALQETIGPNGECGYCVSPHDSREFAEKIIYLITHDQVRKEMGERGFIRANNLFDSEVMSKTYYELLKE